MRAVQVETTTGPADLKVNDIPEPTPGADDVLVEVHSVGRLLPRPAAEPGEYQMKPEPPFNLGVDFAGVVLDPGSSDFTVGQRVAGVAGWGNAAEVVASPKIWTFPLPDALSFDEGAALPMNYLTAQFALKDRGGITEGDTVLVHGAAGGVGTATIQVAKGYGARTIAVVSSPEKAQVALDAGADEAVPDRRASRTQVKELTGGRGVDIVLDVVGGDLFTDSLRCLAEQGRLLVVGFAAGQGIPEVKVNRLLLNNVDVRGVGWGAYAMTRQDFMQQQWRELLPMIEAGVDQATDRCDVRHGRLRPGAASTWTTARTLGKSVVRVRLTIRA